MFLSALIVPDFEAIKEYADSHRIPYESVHDLARKKEIYDLIENDLDKFQKKLANYKELESLLCLIISSLWKQEK